MKNSTPVRIARDPAKPSATDKTNVAVIAIRSMFLYQFIFSTNLAHTSSRAPLRTSRRTARTPPTPACIGIRIAQGIGASLAVQPGQRHHLTPTAGGALWPPDTSQFIDLLFRYGSWSEKARLSAAMSQQRVETPASQSRGKGVQRPGVRTAEDDRCRESPELS